MTGGKKWPGALAIVALIIAGACIAHRCDIPTYSYHPVPLPATFDAYYSRKLAISKKLHARPQNEERLVRYAKGKTPIAILYIHGYGASRAEGEAGVDAIAKEFRANTYYLRLPGHGTNKEEHRDTAMAQLLDEAITALFMMQQLGDRVIVVGTSMGGALATWLAAEYPDRVAGVVLCSPFYNFASTAARMAQWRPFFKGYTLINPIRNNLPADMPKEDNWTRYWYPVQYFAALRQVIDLSRLVDRKEVIAKVSVPVLLLYYYENEEKQDGSASVADMRRVFRQFGTATKPNPLNREVALKDSSHVLLSKWEKSDMKTAVREITKFIQKVIYKK